MGAERVMIGRKMFSLTSLLFLLAAASHLHKGSAEVASSLWESPVRLSIAWFWDPAEPTVGVQRCWFPTVDTSLSPQRQQDSLIQFYTAADGFSSSVAILIWEADGWSKIINTVSLHRGSVHLSYLQS